MHNISYVVKLYSFLAFLSLGVFGALHVAIENDVFLGSLELVGSGIFLLNMWLASITKNVPLTKTLLLLTILAFLIVMLATGGTHGTGAFWFFVFPVTAFFLTNKREGIWWMAGLFLATTLVWLLSINGWSAIAYDDITIRQLLVSLVVVTIGIYAYEQSREQLRDQSRESRRALHSEQVRADVIVQQIDEGVIATDSEGRVTFMNATAEKLLGWQASDLLGSKFIDKVAMLDMAGAEIPAQSRPLARTLTTSKPVVAIATYRRKDGTHVPVSVSSRPIPIDGSNTGAIATIRDISEEQSIARAKSEFVTLASHQLRTPISAVSWLSELLLNGDAGELSAQQREHIEDIYTSNRRMASLVNEMLIVSSLELNALPVRPEPIDLAKLTAKIIEEQVALHKEAKHRIKQNFGSAPPQVACDTDVTKLIIRNLISNALKYTPRGGDITIGITRDPNMKLRHDSQGSVVITVTDTGYGIPESAVNKIFTKFYRAENILHKDTDGTGLGLYIVKQLLDYVGGNISFNSHEGEGTTFTVTLPLEGMIKHEVRSHSVGALTKQGVFATEQGRDV